MATEPDGPKIKQCFSQIVESTQRTVLLDFSNVPMMTSAGIAQLARLPVVDAVPDSEELVVVFVHPRLQAGSPSAGSGQSFVETKKMVLMK